MTEPMTWINPGEWTALSNGGVWALAHTASDQGRDLEVWKAASAPGITAHRVLDIMLGAGLDDLPEFVIAAASGNQIRIIVRHPATARLTTGEDIDEISAEPGVTWLDVIRPLPEQLVLSTGTPPTDTIELPLALGAGAADLVTIDFTAVPEPLPEPEPVPGDATAFMSVEDILADEDPLPAEAEPEPDGPTVLAVRCSQGHLSDPTRPVCRVCRGPIPGQAPFQVPPQPLGCIVVPSGDRIPVDDGVVLGRAPVASGSQKLVTIAFSGEISRQHAEVWVDGWNVYIRDLQTTNGTTLTAPGQPKVTLRAGETYSLEPGAEFDLANAVTLRFEAAADSPGVF